MVKKFILLVLVILFSISGIGCTLRLVDFTLISTKNVDLARGADFKRGQSRIEGEDSVAIIIFIPTGVPNIKEAVDKAIESIPGAIALVDGVITYKYWWFIFGQTTYVVEGTPLIDPALTSSSKLQSNYIISRLNNKGDVIETKYVSKAEYESIKKGIGI